MYCIDYVDVVVCASARGSTITYSENGDFQILHCVQKKTPTHSFFHISMSDA